MAVLPTRFAFLALGVIGPLLAGCTSLPTAGDYMRNAPTGIAPGEAIAVVLKMHRRPDGEEGWIETSFFRGEVFDLRHQRAAGTVTASASGQEGRGMGLVLIFPFPILYGSSTEERACRRFGEQLARLIAG